MKIVCRVSLPSNISLRTQLLALGANLKGSSELIETFEFILNEEGTDKIEMLLSSIPHSKRIITKFTAFEMKSASHFAIAAQWHNGYPQPEDSFKSVIYNLDSFCEACGINKVQKSLFCLKKAPIWKTKQVFGLNWVFDELFVQPSAWEELLGRFGIETDEVLFSQHSTQTKLVRQLQIPIFECRLQFADEHVFETCKKCGHNKYNAPTKGFYPALNTDVVSPMFKTSDWIGSGASAFHPIIVSDDFYRAYNEFGLKGLVFHPLASRS